MPKSHSHQSQLHTLTELSRKLAMDHSQLSRYAAEQGFPPPIRQGKRRLWDETAVRRWLRGNIKPRKNFAAYEVPAVTAAAVDGEDLVEAPGVRIELDDVRAEDGPFAARKYLGELYAEQTPADLQSLADHFTLGITAALMLVQQRRGNPMEILARAPQTYFDELRTLMGQAELAHAMDFVISGWVTRRYIGDPRPWWKMGERYFAHWFGGKAPDLAGMKALEHRARIIDCRLSRRKDHHGQGRRDNEV